MTEPTIHPTVPSSVGASSSLRSQAINYCNLLRICPKLREATTIQGATAILGALMAHSQGNLSGSGLETALVCGAVLILWPENKTLQNDVEKVAADVFAKNYGAAAQDSVKLVQDVGTPSISVTVSTPAKQGT